MLLDSQCLFSDAQKIDSSEVISQNVVKFGKDDVSFVPVLIQVVEDFTNLTSLTVQIQTCVNAEFASSTILEEAKLTIDNLKAGDKFPICHLPHGNLGYIRLNYKIEGEVPASGKITAGVVASSDYSYHNMR